MSAPLMPTAYMPPVAYLAVLAQHGQATIEACETYPKQTVRNRATVLTANGTQDLAVPVTRTNGNHTLTQHIAVDHSRPWARTHLRTLDAAYAASPYYFYYRDRLAQTLQTPYPTLLQLNTALLQLLLQLLKTECQLTPSTDFAPPHSSPLDLRHAFGPKHATLRAECPPYTQVFADRTTFTPNLSAIDLLCNLGPEGGDYLKEVKIIL